MKLWLKGASQIVTITNDNQQFLRGQNMKNIHQLTDDNGLSLLVNEHGHIVDIGTDTLMESLYSETDFETILHLNGCSIIPGLIDAHTHPVWAGDRIHEFAMKLAGATYMEVHEAGGGIHFTVEATRKASEEELTTLLHSRVDRMLRNGTTTVEVKSGYGLELETELKMLKVIENVRKNHPIEMSSTFCGAHSIPRGKTAEETTKDLIESQLPQILNYKEKGLLNVENIDVFCEKGVFNVEQTKRILEAGKAGGLSLNFHGDELNYLGAAEMGSLLNSRAISHLEEISPEGIVAMAKSESVAVILPTTAYILRLKSPPIREMINSNVIIALGSDFNPNAYCLSMPMAMHLSCVNLRMSLEEALTAATLNAAYSIHRSSTHGSLEVGKVADIVVIDANRWEHLIYQLAEQHQIIKYVIKNGDIVYRKKSE